MSKGALGQVSNRAVGMRVLLLGATGGTGREIIRETGAPTR
jgi:hypothetical protein